MWYVSVLKPQEWNAAQYNISGECDYIINQPYAPLDERLKILAKYLQNTDAHHKSALNMLNNLEYTIEYIASQCGFKTARQLQRILKENQK